MNSQYELMAPAGSFPMLSAAVKAGADAVYFGLDEFSMRASSKNFRLEDLEQIRKICNRPDRSVKMYLTLNTIVYDQEIERLSEVLSFIKDKVDAVICWDHAVMILCREKEIPFFISTQASVANRVAAEFYKSLGATRIVLARELNLGQIKEISDVVEVECFVHGAMCVAESGRCFMSVYTSDRSANRGSCVQNCRRSYTVIDDSGHELKVENSRIMSAKDLCGLAFIEEMKAAGVYSFKIEGRGRDPRYVDTVTSVYRRALDNKLTGEEIQESIVKLETVFNRQFSSGFFLGQPAQKDFSTSENNDATETKHTLGKIVNYYAKQQVAAIKLTAELALGDKIAVIGDRTGVETVNVSRMEIDNREVTKAAKGDLVGIMLPGVHRNDQVYLIKAKI